MKADKLLNLRTVVTITNDPRFFFIEFICIAVSAILWKINPGLSWQPLLLAITPLFLRIVAQKSPFIRTPFDFPIIIFLFTAVVGIWAAYQPAAAWTKFWFLVISILVYYLLARQPVDNLWFVTMFLSLVGLGTSIYFFLSNNWEIQPHKFVLISQLGEVWMRIRPHLNLLSLNPNDIAGIAVITLPFSIALILRFWRKKTYRYVSIFTLITGIIAMTILFTESRGAWLAVGVTSGMCFLWWVVNRLLTRYLPTLRKVIYGLIVGLILCVSIGIAWATIQHRLVQIAVGRVDSFISDSRFHLFLSAVELIKDVPFTGGGLESFPGLYSTYIMNNPNFIIGYSHNIFLDASLQQGILGGLMLCWIILGSFIILALKSMTGDLSILRYSILSSLLIMILHGLVDNIVLRTLYTMLIFMIPGMAIGLLTLSGYQRLKVSQGSFQQRHLILATTLVLVIIIGSLLIFRQPILSGWYTDLGAVEMAKVQLHNFPTGTWDEGQDRDQLLLAEALINRAVYYEPNNPGAQYRLGLMAMLDRDFPTAVKHLEIAHLGDPYHRGIIKMLGLSYLWNGQIDAAEPLLSLLPESNQEVNVYSWWWGQQDRPDLISFAREYLKLVGAEQ